MFKMIEKTKSRLKKIKKAAIDFTAWLTSWGAMFLAFFGGYLVAATFVGSVLAWINDFIGELIGGVLHIFGAPDVSEQIPVLAWILFGLVILLDLRDFTPNYKGVYSMLVWPSLMRNIEGVWGAKLNHFANSIEQWFDQALGYYIGAGGAFLAAGVVAGAAMITIHKGETRMDKSIDRDRGADLGRDMTRPSVGGLGRS